MSRALLLLAICGVTAAQNSPKKQSDEVENLVTKVSANYREFKDIEMPFTQKKYVTILKKPLVSSGTVLWMADRILFRTEKEEKSEVLITKKAILIWIPESKKIEKHDRTRFKLMETLDIGVGGNVSAMLKHYTVTIEKKHPKFGEDEDAVLLKLIPTNKQIRKQIREMWMWVRKKDHLIPRMEYKDKTGDRTVTEFDLDTMKKNQGLTEEDIKLSAPANTKVVEPLGPDK